MKQCKTIVTFDTIPEFKILDAGDLLILSNLQKPWTIACKDVSRVTVTIYRLHICSSFPLLINMPCGYQIYYDFYFLSLSLTTNERQHTLQTIKIHIDKTNKE